MDMLRMLGRVDVVAPSRSVRRSVHCYLKSWHRPRLFLGSPAHNRATYNLRYPLWDLNPHQFQLKLCLAEAQARYPPTPDQMAREIARVQLMN